MLDNQLFVSRNLTRIFVFSIKIIKFFIFITQLCSLYSYSRYTMLDNQLFVSLDFNKRILCVIVQETYCDILIKYKSDLSRPFSEASTFLSNIETQLGDIINKGKQFNCFLIFTLVLFLYVWLIRVI